MAVSAASLPCEVGDGEREVASSFRPGSPEEGSGPSSVALASIFPSFYGIEWGCFLKGERRERERGVVVAFRSALDLRVSI